MPLLSPAEGDGPVDGPGDGDGRRQSCGVLVADVEVVLATVVCAESSSYDIRRLFRGLKVEVLLLVLLVLLALW